MVLIVVNLLKLHHMPNNRCLLFCNTALFVFIRLVISFYCFFELWPSWISLRKFNATLTKVNWWKDGAHVHFFTNCSPYNMLVCWCIWFVLKICTGVLFILACMLLINILTLFVIFIRNAEEGCRKIIYFF